MSTRAKGWVVCHPHTLRWVTAWCAGTGIAELILALIR